MRQAKRLRKLLEESKIEPFAVIELSQIMVIEND